MANPKVKTSRSKTRRRRTHYKLGEAKTTNCPQCHEPKLPHRICLSCGTYNKRSVITQKEEKAKK
ncbi:MAG: 50S ribosomal protein L32 [Armatimonadota bacterium]